VSGLPTGAVANIPLPVGPGNSAVRIATTNATPAGTFPIVISGTSGGLKHSVTVNLTVSATAGTIPMPVSLASSYNLTGIYTDGKKFTGGADGDGFAFSGSLLGASQTVNDLAFNLGPPNAPNIVVNTTTSLPSGRFSTLHMLATAVNGNQRAQVLTVTYTDGTASSFTQSLSDWAVVTTYSGQNVAISMPYRNAYNGTANGGSFHGYIYSFALDPAKTLRSFTLPNNPKVLVLAITLTPQGTAIMAAFGPSKS
jgi:alpha-mannosidase